MQHELAAYQGLQRSIFKSTSNLEAAAKEEEVGLLVDWEKEN